MGSKGEVFFFILYKIIIICIQYIVGYFALKNKQFYFFRYTKWQRVNALSPLCIKSASVNLFSAVGGHCCRLIRVLYTALHVSLSIAS